MWNELNTNDGKFIKYYGCSAHLVSKFLPYELILIPFCMLSILAHTQRDAYLYICHCVAVMYVLSFAHTVNVQLTQKMWWLNCAIASKGHMQLPYNGKASGIVMVLGQNIKNRNHLSLFSICLLNFFSFSNFLSFFLHSVWKCMLVYVYYELVSVSFSL